MAKIILKKGKEKPLLRRHPWIFANAIDQVINALIAGDTVDVISYDGEFLARAAYSPHSQIRARVWTWDENEAIDKTFFYNKIQNAIKLRQTIIPKNETNALRLVHAESDNLPGLIVDLYADNLVIQCLTAGTEYWKNVIVDALIDLTHIHNVYERSDLDVRRLEGLPETSGVLAGNFPPEKIIINENGLLFYSDIVSGQKTGFFLDQRRNRQRLLELVKDRNVLNCFCYTGAFSVYALSGGAASVLSVDTSAGALEIAAQNITLNGLPEEKAIWVEDDVFHFLRTLRDRAQTFDAIILDPPKFAPTSAQAEQAARGYKDINLLAFKLLKPGGLLFTFSCSGGITIDLFQKIVAGAALDAGVNARIVDRLGQGPDHPVSLSFPEGTS